MTISMKRKPLTLVRMLLMGLLLAFVVTGCGAPKQEWLTNGSWLAHPDWYDYLQAATFKADGTGDLVQGDSQHVRHEEQFRYQIRELTGEKFLQEPADLLVVLKEQRRFALKFTCDEDRVWSGEVQLEEGPFEFVGEGPDRTKSVFRYRLRFSHCPFGWGGTSDYYGHRQSSEQDDAP